MKILLDQGTPAPLRRELVAHEVDTAFERGWAALNNGELLTSAESDGYQLLITTDQNLQYQQNLSERVIAILVLTSTSWPRIQTRIAEICEAIDSTEPGTSREIHI